MHSPVTSAPDSDKHASTKSCQLAIRDAEQVEEVKEVKEEEKGTSAYDSIARTRSDRRWSHVYFARNAVAPENIKLCAVVAAVPVHEEMSWLNAEAE